MSDAKAATQDEGTTPTEVPRRAQPWRVFAKGCVLTLMLGAGWIAGAKTHEIAQVSSPAWAQVVGLGASLETALARMASWAAPQERTASSGVESSPTTASPEGGLDQFAGKLEQIRAASEGAADESRRSAERLASAMDSNSQQLAMRLADLGERLDRLERNAPAAAGSVLTKLEQLSERLDRIPTSATPAARSATGPVEALRPAASPALNLQGLSEARKIPNWVVREVINGKAILQGPRGVIGVSRGDLVPGVGRVQSIARQGSRWIVATNNGVIGAR